ncbi:MAG: hypothetical protein CR981_02900, partial [Proteobacteria bacterium]
YNQLKNNQSLGADRENWLKGAQNFRRIYLAEPKSSLAPGCLFMLGNLYNDLHQKFKQGIDLGEAISYYRDVGTLFPGSKLADDAYFAVGLILLHEVKDPKRAAKSFARIVSEYPEGDMYPEAVQKLKILSQEYNIPLPDEMIGNAQLKKLTNVLPVKYWSSRDYTRVVIKTSGPVTYHEVLLEEIGNQPRRLYIDFQNSYTEPRFRAPVPIEDGLLRRVRTGQNTPDTVRVVLDIESISSYKIFSLPDPFRVVIDVRGVKKKKATATAETRQKRSDNSLSDLPSAPQPTAATIPHQPVTTTTPQAEAEIGADPEPAVSRPPDSVRKSDNDHTVVVFNDKKKFPVSGYTSSRKLIDQTKQTPTISLARQLGLGVGKIVIDPGHGGKDPGAMAFGMKEKDIVLKAGKALAKCLRDRLKAEVILTRDRDIFIPLEERTAIANTNDADLFISLHINAHPSSKVKGFETYFLSLSTNEEAMRVAARENATSTHQMSDLQDILSDIMQNSKINESFRLAQQVHNAIDRDLTQPPYKLKNMGVKQAPFYVLIGAGMPSILVEMAFISNPEDVTLLKNDSFINDMASSITNGILHYVHTNTAQL